MYTNKTELIATVAEKTGVSKAIAHEVINATLDTIVKTTAEGNSVALVGFGTFECRNRKPRMAHSPRTGEPVEVPARRVVVFRPGKSLKEASAVIPADGK